MAQRSPSSRHGRLQWPRRSGRIAVTAWRSSRRAPRPPPLRRSHRRDAFHARDDPAVPARPRRLAARASSIPAVFDSIPSDIGVLALHEAAGELAETTLVLHAGVKGGVSGGTLASMKGTVDDVKRDRSLARVLADPYALSRRPGCRTRARGRSPRCGVLRGPRHLVRPVRDGAVNTRVVRRSRAPGLGLRATLPLPRGDGFRLRPRRGGPGVGGGMAALTAGLACRLPDSLSTACCPIPAQGRRRNSCGRGSS